MRSLAAMVLMLSSIASAEEGMWLFNELPTEQVKKDVGFAPDQVWLDRVRLGSLRLANGCSASIVSPNGLVMTNHHCIRACLEDLSTKERELLTTGFLASGKDKEEKCPKFEGNQLQKITDVTAQILGGNFGYEPQGNRAVAVHGELILTALRQVYGASHVAKELRP